MILIAGLCATLAIAAAAILAHAVTREPLPKAVERVALPLIPRPPAPERLTPDPAFLRRDHPAAVAQEQPQPVTVPIRLDALPPVLRGRDAGVAAFQAETGSNFLWLPLGDGLHGPGGQILVTATAPRGTTLVLTAATDRKYARHGYLARRLVEIPATSGIAVGIVDLRVEIAEVRFDLPQTVERAGPLQLVRLDDPQWLPMRHPTGLILGRGITSIVTLGAGRYELRDPLDTKRRQQFDVPATTVVELNLGATPARADRP